MNKIFKFNHLKLISALILCLSNIQFAHAMEEEAKLACEKAIISSSRVAKIHEAGVKRRAEESRQLGVLLRAVQENHAVDQEKLKQMLIAKLEADSVCFSSLDQQVEAHEKALRQQVITNKLSIITKETLSFAEKHFFDILDGRLPHGYSIKPPLFNYVKSEDHIFCNGRRGNALKSVLLNTCLIQNGKTSLSEISSLFGPTWLDQCPFLHINALPEVIDVSKLQSSSHFFKDGKTPQAFVSIHNGYAFGGHRGERRYPRGSKEWGPHDCSSFVAKYVGTECEFTTADQATLFQVECGFQFAPYAKNGVELAKFWESNRAKFSKEGNVQSIRTVLTPIADPKNPASLVPGCVHAERYYHASKIKPWNVLIGNGGHTGIFIGTVGSGADIQALTIGANRDLEKTGQEFIYGLEERKLFGSPQSEKIVMYFDVNE